MMPRVIREWTLTSEIGRGGMGVVYRARHRFLAGDWAVKVILPQLAGDGESRERFLSEAMLLSNLQHPGIVSILPPFQENDELFLPMELLTGKSLDSLLKEVSAPWDSVRSVDILLQVADAVGYAHRRTPPVIHRDIKPSNIQVMDDGRVKVFDFGLARAVGDKSMTATGNLVGTPVYMAPEVLKGRRANQRSDVFSLGITLFQMLTGQLPYELPEDESSLHALYMSVILGNERGLPDVREFSLQVPAWLAALTAQMLSGNPEDRPADAGCVAEMLSASRTFGSSTHVSADKTRIAINLDDLPGVAAALDGHSFEFGSDRSEVGSDRSIVKIDVAAEHLESPNNRFQESSSLQSSPSVVKAAHGASGKMILLSVVALALVSVSVLGIWLIASDSSGSDVEGVRGIVEDSPSSVENDSPPGNTTAPVASETKSFVETPAGIRWIRIPGGTYQMGSIEGKNVEMPIHQVSVADFEMAATEVTVAQYEKCVRAGKCLEPESTQNHCNWGKPGFENHPVNCVDWNRASAFAAWVGGRLPTEAEWEYAARAGGRDQTYPWGESPATCTLAVMKDSTGRGCGREGTWPVCSKPDGNTLHGLCDMAGNVWEWVSDWFGDYSSRSVSNPEGPDSGSRRTYRGGSWHYGTDMMRVSIRYGIKPEFSSGYLGFRPVRSVR